MRHVREQLAGAGPAERPRSCPACGGGRVRFWRFASASDLSLAQRPSYRLQQCVDCGTASLADAVQLEGLDLEPASQDAVVLWHVLEHLADPGEALRRIRRWLRPSGALVVAVPNLSSLQARIGGDRWFHQDVPRHRTQFSRAGL